MGLRVGSGRLNVTRTLGDLGLGGEVLREPDVFEVCVDEEGVEFVLFGTDGFWDVWGVEEVVEYVCGQLRRQPAVWNASPVVAAVLAETARRKPTDNVAVGLLTFYRSGIMASSTLCV